MLKRVSFVVLSVALIAAYESAIGQPQELKTPTTAEAIAANLKFEESAPVEDEELPCVISRFDNLMRKVGAEEGQDWRLMSAIAYSESRFIENLVSKQGAKGIMQIRPVVARHFKMPVESISDTETNIRLAGMLLSELDDMLRMPSSTPEQDRLSIILASYNAGLGHVQDARRLAKADGANPNSWAVVSNYLKLKANPDYYTRAEVKAGRFSGSRETLGFVELAMKQYTHYCEIAW